MGKNKPKKHNSSVANVSSQKKTTPKALVIDKNNKYVLGGYFSLGLSNFYKTVLLVFAKTGIRIMSDKGNVLFDDEKIGKVLFTLYKSTLKPRPQLEPSERAWAVNFNLNVNQQVKLQQLLFHHFPILGPIMADEEAYKVIKSKKSNVTDPYSMTFGVTLTECLKVISNIAQGLVDCRNTEVHYDPYNSPDDLAKQYLVQEDIVRYLNKALVASRRIDKKRNSIDTRKMEFLTGYAKQDSESLDKYLEKWHFSPKYDQVPKTDEDGNVLYVVDTDKDGNPKKDKDGNPVYKLGKPKFKDGKPNYEVQTKMVERNDFFYKIGGEKSISNQSETYYTLTGFGLAYFCSIFLSKPQAKQMLSDIKLFEKSPYPQDLNDIIRDMLSIYRIRSPRGKKLEGVDSKMTLALDILNELRKCPKELYDVLGPEGQKKFEDKVVHENERTPDVVKRFRSADRFPQLALRYIDETGLFENIRFQVQLGKLRFKFYPKVCINGEEEIRSLQKEINGFGKLQEIEIKRKTDYKELLQVSAEKSVKIEGENLYLNLLQMEKDKADSKPYITDSRASYNIHNERIGLLWSEKIIKQDNGEERVKIQRGDFLPDLSVVENGKAPVDMPAPMAMLSTRELPALIFYQYLREANKDTQSKSPEDIICEKCNNLKKFFKDVSYGILTPMGEGEFLVLFLKERYGLEIHEIPQKIFDYLTEKDIEIETRKAKRTKDILVRRLKKAIRRRDGFKDDRSKIGEKDNAYGKNSYVDVRHGSLARYLSESFLEWQPTAENGKDKLTGLNFSKLQSELAVFDSKERFEIIKSMLQKAHMLDGNIAHPFLPQIVNKNIRNIEELYLLYLNAEIKYLRELFGIEKQIKDKDIDFDKLELDSPDYKALPFIKGIKKWNERNELYYRQLAKRYLEVEGKRAPILLPDSLFASHILKLLNLYYSNNKTLQDHLSKKDMANNVAYMITSFFKDQLDDNSQPFYFSSTRISESKSIPNDYAHIYDLFNILNYQKTKENAFVKVPMPKDEIKRQFSTWYTNEQGEREVRKDSKGNEVKNTEGEICYKKLIHQQIEELPDKIYKIELNKAIKKIDEKIKKGRLQEKFRDNEVKKAKRKVRLSEEEKTKLVTKLTRQISDVKDNERAILRYKTQDMILFLIADKLIGKSMVGAANKNSKFKLANVCHSDFLSQTVNFEFPFTVDEKTVYIKQEGMSLKNYGEFYQLLSDDRLPSLLKKLADAKKQEEKITFDYNNLMGELASYNILRSHIFRAVHKLEEYVESKDEFKDFLDAPNDDRFYIGDDNSRDPKRNNFRELLYLLEQSDEDILNSDAKELIISIRNAFSHNHYNVDFGKIATPESMQKSTLIHKKNDKNDDEKLTTIAKLIKTKMEELQKLVCDGIN